LAGVSPPQELEADFEAAYEIINGHPLRTDREDTLAPEAPSASLTLVRAARQLSQDDASSAILSLRPLLSPSNIARASHSAFGSAPPSEADLLELSSSLRASEDGGVKDAAKLLREAYAA